MPLIEGDEKVSPKLQQELDDEVKEGKGLSRLSIISTS